MTRAGEARNIGLGVSAIADRALIADAKEKATTGKPGGDEAASDDRLDALQLRNAFSSASPLDGGS